MARTDAATNGNAAMALDNEPQTTTQQPQEEAQEATLTQAQIDEAIAQAIAMVNNANAAQCSVNKTLHEIQKSIATITLATMQLDPAQRILQAMLDAPCIKNNAKRMINNLDFIIGYYASVKTLDNGKTEITPHADPARIIQAQYMEGQLILDWIITPKKLSQLENGRHQEKTFYADLNRKAEVINQTPVKDWTLAQPDADQSIIALRKICKTLQTASTNKEKLINGKSWKHIDAILQAAQALGLIEYESNKPQDQRPLANTAKRNGQPKTPTR